MFTSKALILAFAVGTGTGAYIAHNYDLTKVNEKVQSNTKSYIDSTKDWFNKTVKGK